MVLSDLGFGNQLVLPEESVLENLRGVQARNGIAIAPYVAPETVIVSP